MSVCIPGWTKPAVGAMQPRPACQSRSLLPKRPQAWPAPHLTGGLHFLRPFSPVTQSSEPRSPLCDPRPAPRRQAGQDSRGFQPPRAPQVLLPVPWHPARKQKGGGATSEAALSSAPSMQGLLGTSAHQSQRSKGETQERFCRHRSRFSQLSAVALASFHPLRPGRTQASTGHLVFM